MSSQPPQIEFYRAADGRRLAVRVWRTSEPPRGRVAFVHGITSHGGWYSRSGNHLASAGFEVHFLDRRGSGLNIEQAGDIDRWQTWIDDVTVYLNTLADPILCGISWGGKLAVAVARQHPELLIGLGLVCPGLFSHHEPGVLKRLLLAAPLPRRLARRRVRIPLADPALFIGGRDRQEFVATDPLALREITLRMVQADRGLTRIARDAAPFLHVPILLMLAGQDRIVDNRPTRAFFARAAGRHKTLIEYPNATHTLEFEPDPSRYFVDLARWVQDTQTHHAACGSLRGC